MGSKMSGHTTEPEILLVDDDRELRDLVSAQLVAHGFSVRTADSAASARQHLSEGRYDLVLLDIGLGDGDGMDICRTLRAQGNQPVIMLTARADPVDRILGIEMGADDYVVKPFHPRELVARIRAVLRRANVQLTEKGLPPRVFGFLGWRLDVVRRELRRPDHTLVPLSDAEFDVFLILVERAQRVVSRDEIFQCLHGRVPDPEDRSLDLRLSRLRRKIEIDARQPALIKTVRNGGFLFAEPVSVE